jgi:hypothetical protein
MPQPTPYNRLYNFTDWQTVNPSKPLPGTELDAELNAVKLTSDQTRANLGLIQRDDGRLANQSVSPEALSPGALAIISQGQYVPRGSWAAANNYAAGDVVEFNLATYLALSAHTSDTVFANDLSAGRWLLLANAALSGSAQAVDLFAGNGTTTVFTLALNYANSNAVQVFVNGVAQLPTQDFTVVNDQITFVTAPPTPSQVGTSNIMVRGTAVEVQIAASQATTAEANAQQFAAAALASQTAAASSETAAAGSATSAATSATNAASSQTAAASSASAAASSATNAANSATAASTSATNAATSATNAGNSATAASTSATNAAASATTATSQATAASTSATNAATSATNASNSASAASTSASQAATSATNAANSATNAAGSATSATTSASLAATSETNAANSATAASASASAASASETAAAGSASAAATSQASASASATNAATSETNAATSATNALTSETNAASSAVSAASSAASAAAILDNFDDRYLGPKASDPALDNDGDPLVVGALYFNTTDGVMKIYTNSGWIAASSASVATLNIYEYVATASQTTFTGADANGNTLSYVAPALIVTLNGVRLRPGDDYTATDGVNIVLASGASVNDELVVDAFGNFLVSSAVDKTGDTMTGPLVLSGNPTTNLQAAPKQYVDTAVAGVDLSSRVSKSGDTMNGTLQMGAVGNNILFPRGTDNTTSLLIRSQSGGNELQLVNDSGTTGNMVAIGNGVVRIQTENVERVRVDSSGRVTIPNQTVVEVSRTALFGVTTNDAVGTVIPWDSEHIDRGNNFDQGGTNRFTAPVAGCYEFHWSYGANVNGNTVYRTFLWVNGSRVVHSQLRNDNSKSGTAYSWGSRTLILNLSANDYVELRASSDSGADFLGDNTLRVSMGIYLIG